MWPWSKPKHEAPKPKVAELPLDRMEAQTGRERQGAHSRTVRRDEFRNLMATLKSIPLEMDLDDALHHKPKR